MPNQRFVSVRATLDTNSNPWLVGDPHMPGRWLGVTKKATPDPDPDGLSSHFEPASALAIDHSAIRGMVADGHLELLGEATAKSHDAALAALAPKPPKPVAPKRADTGVAQ